MAARAPGAGAAPCEDASPAGGEALGVGCRHPVVTAVDAAVGGSDPASRSKALAGLALPFCLLGEGFKRGLERLPAPKNEAMDLCPLPMATGFLELDI